MSPPSNRSRRRSGGSGGGNSSGGGGGGNANRNKGGKGGGNRNQNRRTKSRAPGKGPNRDFWGDRLEVGDDKSGAQASNDPTAMIRSLGDPPLRGHEPAAQQYFDVVYKRAASVAFALAAASGVIDPSGD